MHKIRIHEDEIGITTESAEVMWTGWIAPILSENPTPRAKNAPKFNFQ